MSATGDDPYLEPGTECLRNKLGIREAGLLAVVEAEIVANRAIRLANSPGLVPRTWDQAHWQNLHRHLFGDVYDWAGEFRTVDIAKEGRIPPGLHA